MPSEASKIGPAARSQLLSAYLVQRIAFGAPSASRTATSSARVCSSASGTASETRPMRSASFAGDRLAQQQVVLGFGYAAKQRPDDRSVIAGGDAELGMAVDQLGGIGGN